MKKFLGNLLVAVVFGLGVAMVAYPAAITQLAGLAVAQSTTQWNQLKDFAIGDAQTNGAGLFAPCLFNGVTCDRQRGTIANGALTDISRISGAITPADAFANPTTANTMWSLNGVFNGATWDRARTASADALAATGLAASAGSLFNGSTWDREDSASATNNTATTSLGVAYSTPLSTWSQTNTPAVTTAATTSKASGGGSVRHVATSITACVAANATAQTPLLIHLRDGATGAGTILRTWAISAVVSESHCVDLSGLNMTGSAATAMTLETAAAPAAGVQATVSFTGYSTP
jgi:hypothetical protein